MIRNKLASETRAIGMYVFAVSLILTFVAVAYTLLFDITGTLPVTRICNVIILCASAIGIAYSYIAAESAQERHLARTYARRDAVVIVTMAIYFVTGNFVFGMVADALHYGISVLPMLSEPTMVSGYIVMGASVVAMVLLAILDRMAKKEIAEIAKRDQQVLVKPVPEGIADIVTTDDESTPPSTHGDDAYDGDEILSYIPLSQVRTGNFRPVVTGGTSNNARPSVQMTDFETRRKENRHLRRIKRQVKVKSGLKSFFANIRRATGKVTSSAWHIVVTGAQSVAHALSTVATILKNGICRLGALGKSCVTVGIPLMAGAIGNWAHGTFVATGNAVSDVRGRATTALRQKLPLVKERLMCFASGCTCLVDDAVTAFGRLRKGIRHARPASESEEPVASDERMPFTSPVGATHESTTAPFGTGTQESEEDGTPREQGHPAGNLETHGGSHATKRKIAETGGTPPRLVRRVSPLLRARTNPSGGQCMRVTDGDASEAVPPFLQGHATKTRKPMPR